MTSAGEQGGAGRRSRIARIVLVAIVAILAIVGPLVVRAAIEGRAELRAADEASGTEQAIVHLGRAARWRLPIAEHDERARERLEQLAIEAEQADDDALALVAWRELRGALLGTRAWSVVDPEQLERANAGIVRGMLAIAEAEGEPGQGERWQAELDAPPATDGASTRIAALCFALWGITLIGFVIHAVPRIRERRRAALGWAAVNLTSLLGWLLFM
jgi:hypothetical protein